MKRLLRILYQPYKWLVFIPAAALFTLVLGGVAVTFSFVLDQSTVSRLCGVTWARLNAFITPMMVRVRGRQNVDPKSSYVVVSNHRSAYDIFVLYGWLGIDFKWVMKQELRKAPALGIACEKVGHIFIDRSSHEAAVESLERAKKKIVDGTSVVFFPEGTRSRGGELAPFKKGAFRMALDLGLPILPVTITGTRSILPPKSLDLFPGRATLTIHPPISTEGYDEGSLPNLIQRVRQAVASALLS